jgi:hypothetical protein
MASSHLIRLQAREDAPPFALLQGDGLALTPRGRIVADCWKALAQGRPGLAADALAISPHAVEGILRIGSPREGGPSLAEAVRLFKVLSALRLSRSAPGRAGPGKGGSVQDTPGRPGRAAVPPLWRKGYGETPLAGAGDLAEAREALRMRGARGD